MSSQPPRKKLLLKIDGTHCASCEVLIERKFKRVPGVEGVRVNHATGKAVVSCSSEPDLRALAQAVADDGYAVLPWSERHKARGIRTRGREYMEIGGMFIILAALYLVLHEFHLLPSGLAISDHMSYGFVFLIGLVAASSSCIAVTGGLFLAMSAKYNAAHPEWTRRQKLRPLLAFNLGRIISYTVLGAAIGALGSVFTLSVRATGVVTIAASLVMLLLGFQLLNIFPWLRRFQPRLPKAIAHRIHDASGGAGKTGPFLLGAATFFLPCGFTQALQVYVLSKGSAGVGALTMLAFSLGTLPALLSVGAISSFAKGAFQRYFLKFSGALVISLALFNINNGLTLTGSSVTLASLFSGDSTAAASTSVPVVNGVQVARMTVSDLSYAPSRFTVLQGVPVDWIIDGTAAQGCAQIVTAPSIGVTAFLPRDGTKTIRFVPKDLGTIPFSCTMGMTTRGAAFTVVPNTTGVVAAKDSGAPAPKPGDPADCDSSVADCPVQKVSMEITREQGFSPRFFTVKHGTPVELTIDAKVPLGGCMGTMVIPKYNIAHTIALGISTLRFTPTEAGDVPITCSMGIPIGGFTVT